MKFSGDKKLSPKFTKNASVAGGGVATVLISLSPLALLPVIGFGTLIFGGGAVALGVKNLYDDHVKNGEDILQDATLSPREQQRKDRDDARAKKAEARANKRKSKFSK